MLKFFHITVCIGMHQSNVSLHILSSPERLETKGALVFLNFKMDLLDVVSKDAAS